MHPNLAAGQAAIVERLDQALRALRDDGIETLSRAGAALRRLPGDALTGSAHAVASEIDRAIAELATLSGPEVATADVILRLERHLASVSARLVAASGQHGRL